MPLMLKGDKILRTSRGLAFSRACCCGVPITCANVLEAGFRLEVWGDTPKHIGLASFQGNYFDLGETFLDVDAEAENCACHFVWSQGSGDPDDCGDDDIRGFGLVMCIHPIDGSVTLMAYQEFFGMTLQYNGIVTTPGLFFQESDPWFLEVTLPSHGGNCIPGNIRIRISEVVSV